MTSTQTTTIPADMIRRATRAAKTAHNNAGKDIGIRSQGMLDGILYAIEAMGCDAAEIDALYDTVDTILTGAAS